MSATRVSGNRDGIVLAGTAAPTTIERTEISGTHRLGISVTGGTAVVTDKRVNGAETGIRIRDAEVATTENVVSEATDHAISVVGTATGSSVVGNSISGRGPSGLDTFRLAPELTVELSGNDVEGWTQDRDNLEYWAAFIPSHPMLLLWVVGLGLPLGLGLRARSRRIPLGTQPYRESLRQGPPQQRVDVGAAMALGQQA